jgi:integrase
LPPRKRNAENRSLPARWVYKHGAYYYLPLPGLRHLWDGKSWFLLGRNLPEAFKAWAERAGSPERITTIDALLDRYALQVIPEKAPKTQTGNQRAVRNLRPVFGRMALGDIEPQHIYQYVDKRRAPTQAHREVEVLSHAFTKAVEWGLMKAHPFRKEVRLKGETPRTRYIEDWEIVAALSLSSMRKRGSVLSIQAYIRLKLLTGIARGDMLRLRLGEHIQDDGIHVTRHKTAKKTGGKKTIYEYEKVPERRDVVEQAKRARPVDISPFLFCNKFGKGYVNEETGEAHGFDSMWQRFMDRVLKETAVKERFTEHDIRAKVGSDAESLDHARRLLAHVDSKVTQRVYRRKPERV